MIEGQAGRLGGITDRVGPAGLEERRPAPARQGQLGVLGVRHVDGDGDRAAEAGVIGPCRISGGSRDSRGLPRMREDIVEARRFAITAALPEQPEGERGADDTPRS